MHPPHHLLPQPARLVDVRRESADTSTFVLALETAADAFDAGRPGQFVMLSLLGAGEAAFTLSSLPRAGGRAGYAVLTVRRVGRVTNALFQLAAGARVGLRGPFGRGFPDDHAEVPTLYVAGGCGLSPLKTAIETQLAERPPGTRIGVLFGARDPAHRIHRDALASWSRMPDVVLLECVDDPDRQWQGRVGHVGEFVLEAVAAIGARRAAICGPPVMLAPVSHRLHQGGLDGSAIHLALERHMQCGYGECGHCYVNHRYVCTDGPVFSLAELAALPDAFDDPAADVWSQSCN